MIRNITAKAAMGLLIAGVGLHLTGAGAYSRGVNVAGLGFGASVLPGVVGTNYTANSPSTYKYFTTKGLTLMRISICWERLQPTLNGPLDPAYLKLLEENVAWAGRYGDKPIIDLHNFGRYSINENGTYVSYVLDNKYNGVVKVSRGNLEDVWRRLSNVFRNNKAVYAYDIMNEPYDMGTANWEDISQAVLTTIRSNGDKRLIYIPGNRFSSAEAWPAVNGPKSWITDPAHNFKYEAHEYFDRDSSGTYTWSYDKELAANANLPNVGAERLAPFAKWCRENHVGGYLGEFGAPNSDPRWLTVLDNFYTALDQAGFDGTIWAAGEAWGPNILSVQPDNNFTADSSLMPTMEKHLGTNVRVNLAAQRSPRGADPVLERAPSGAGALVGVSASAPTWGNVYQAVNVSPNADYVASFWVKGTGKAVLRINSGNFGKQITIQAFSATPDWQQYRVYINTGTNSQLTYSFTDGGALAGTTYIDNCFLGVPGGVNMLANSDFRTSASWNCGSPFQINPDVKD